MNENVKPSRFAEKRTGTLNRFYTRDAIGQIMCDLLGDACPQWVLDLGAGEGSLSTAVAERWPNAMFVTVDVDTSCVEELRNKLSERGVSVHHHREQDVLNSSLASVPGYGGFDLAVCNPPFFRPPWRREFAELIEAAGFGSAISRHDITAEAVFLAQNLNALKDGGTLALIMPDGMSTGKRSQSLRRALLRQHSVDAVVQLPNNAFKDTDAYCFIMLLRKNAGPTEKLQLFRYDRKLGLSEPLYTSAVDAAVRMDYGYHKMLRPAGNEFITLGMLGADVRRGAISSADLKAATYTTFHTNGYDQSRLCFEGHVPSVLDSELVIAEQGDILLARIDRNFHKKIAIVDNGRAAITDCIYRVRVPAPLQNAVFEALRSPKTEACLKSLSKGVSARLLGKADLLSMPIDDPELISLTEELLQERQRFSLLL